VKEGASVSDDSYGAELMSESAYERTQGEDYDEAQSFLSEMTDDELLDKVMSAGIGLDTFIHFPAYSVARELKKNGRKPSWKQRNALINCAARHFAIEGHGGLFSLAEKTTGI